MEKQSTSSLTSAHTSSSPQLATLRVILVRHGQSEDNHHAIWAGHRDTSLTALGVNQAKALGKSLANYQLVAIYSSDLKRASLTAEEVLSANRSAPPPPLVQTQSLREQNFGQAEGRSYADAEQVFLSQMRSENARTFHFAEGETLNDVNARMGVSLRRYILPRLESMRVGNDHTEPQIVIVAHGIAIAEILQVLMSLHDSSAAALWADPRDTYKRVRLENTGWSLVELAVPIVNEDAPVDDSRRRAIYVRIVEQNITDHLRGPGLLSAPSGSQAESMLSGATSTPDASSEVSSASSAAWNLRTVNAYDTKNLVKELEKSGSSSSVLPNATGRDGILSATSVPVSTGSAASIASPGSVANSSTLTLTSSTTNLVASPGSWSEPWQNVCLQTLPIFHGDEIKLPIEEVNDLLSDHIKRSLEKSPARALDSLAKDLYAVCATGMYALNARLDVPVGDEVHLLERLVEVWKYFYRRILPWLQGCFLPMQTDATLLSLARSDNNPASALRTEPIEVARVAFTVFRDQCILPRLDRLCSAFCRVYDLEASRTAPNSEQLKRISKSDEFSSARRDPLYPDLLQMSNILYSVLSLNEAQEAMESLVKALQVGRQSHLYLGSIPAKARTPFSTSRGKQNRDQQRWPSRSGTRNPESFQSKATTENAPSNGLHHPQRQTKFSASDGIQLPAQLPNSHEPSLEHQEESYRSDEIVGNSTPP